MATGTTTAMVASLLVSSGAMVTAGLLDPDASIPWAQLGTGGALVAAFGVMLRYILNVHSKKQDDTLAALGRLIEQVARLVEDGRREHAEQVRLLQDLAEGLEDLSAEHTKRLELLERLAARLEKP